MILKIKSTSRLEEICSLSTIYTMPMLFQFLQDCNFTSSDASLANSTTISNSSAIFEENFCIDDIESKACKAGGGSCQTTTDGYYILCLASAAFGMVWLIWAWRTIKRLQEVDITEWRVTRAKAISCYGLTDIVVKKFTGLKG